MKESGRKMKRYKIAFTGVFDLANYGDHLFPIIFEKKMQQKGMNIQIYLFSCFAGKDAFDEKKKVYPLMELEEMHLQEQFDAIVVGGGEIIHLHSFKHRFDTEEYIHYPIYECWVIPAIVSSRWNIPLLWNNPGVPFEFEGFYQMLVKELCESVDYLSVRNDFSVESLQKAGISKEILCCPDTAFLLPKFFPYEYLEKVKKKVLLTEKYVVFQCNRLIDKESLQVAIECLKKLKHVGYDIVLLPLAYTNGDDEFSIKINKENGFQFISFAEKLSLEETIGILACCDIYIGVSFHGAITAYSYGKKVVGYDFFSNKKTRDLFSLLNLSNCYITDKGNLGQGIESAVNQSSYSEKLLDDIDKKLERHFDMMKKIIENYLAEEGKKKYVKSSSVYHLLSNSLALISEDFQNYAGKCDRTKRDKAELEAEVKGLKEYMSIMQMEIEKQHFKVETLNNKLKGLEGLMGKKIFTRLLRVSEKHRVRKNYNNQEK